MSDDLDLLRTKCLLIGYTARRGRAGGTAKWFYPIDPYGEVIPGIYGLKNSTYGRADEREVLEGILRHLGLL